MEICYEQPGYNYIEVVLTAKRRHYLFYLQPYFFALVTFLPI